MFKAATGLTPKAYAEAHRADRLRAGLGKGERITEALYGAGFNSSSRRFYARSTELLGMTPGRYRAGGSDEEIRFAVGACSLGAILVAQSGKGVAAILLGDDPDRLVRDLQDRFPRARLIGADAAFEAVVARVVGLIEAPGLGLDLPLDVRGTAFQQRVWQALQALPPRPDRLLRRDRPTHRRAEGGPRRRKRLCRQQPRGCDPLPPGRTQGCRTVRLCLGRRTQAGADRARTPGLKAMAGRLADDRRRPRRPWLRAARRSAQASGMQ